MKTTFVTLILLASSGLLNASADAIKTLEDKCSSCHMLSSSTKIKADKISAPPMWGIMRKMNDTFTSKEEAITYLVEYAINPSEKTMIFPIEAKKYFGVMPSMKGKVTEDELKAIAEYLYQDK